MPGLPGPAAVVDQLLFYRVNLLHSRVNIQCPVSTGIRECIKGQADELLCGNQMGDTQPCS